jgi:hypothetical protein
VADLQDDSGQVALAAGQHDAGLRPRVGQYFIDDEAADSILSRLTAAVVPGSYLAIMHPASDLDPALLEAGQRWNQLAAQPVRLRSRADMTLPGGS